MVAPLVALSRALPGLNLAAVVAREPGDRVSRPWLSVARVERVGTRLGPGESETEPRPRAVADFALGEFLDLSSKVGHADAIAARLEEIGDRAISGRATQKIGMAREGLAVLRLHHELAVASGTARPAGPADDERDRRTR